MSGLPLPRFWANPLRYIKWSARERPALFWSVVVGAMGPVTLAVVPPIRKRLGDEDAPTIPMTYPIPQGPRKQLTGYDDDTEE
ncbi:NADH:ubiquinone reductase 9.5 kda ubiquinone-binding protein [Podospora didyma]|uniref:NADH:ubiquinone reductase 9.5 kDa ubiquinone-binding protein n=1 Tax=Podospora didyma TaxID=330526 RepID=A0AAE0KAF7_9PEZI|nr:NADH:ubiquinone reductase 9.5 kda ubiquinone-binding protein [Podospora didyma]